MKRETAQSQVASSEAATEGEKKIQTEGSKGSEGLVSS
jgi:hypothetical protein